MEGSHGAEALVVSNWVVLCIDVGYNIFLVGFIVTGVKDDWVTVIVSSTTTVNTQALVCQQMKVVVGSDNILESLGVSSSVWSHNKLLTSSYLF